MISKMTRKFWILQCFNFQRLNPSVCTSNYKIFRSKENCKVSVISNIKELSSFKDVAISNIVSNYQCFLMLQTLENGCRCVVARSECTVVSSAIPPLVALVSLPPHDFGPPSRRYYVFEWNKKYVAGLGSNGIAFTPNFVTIDLLIDRLVDV
jgi:hypothetical protein